MRWESSDVDDLSEALRVPSYRDCVPALQQVLRRGPSGPASVREYAVR
jgi:hypothetical protein